MEHINSIPKIWRRTEFGSHHSGYITTGIRKTNYGFYIKRFSHCISLQNIRLEVYEDVFAKATVMVNKNYHTPYQYTLYFDNKMEPISYINDQGFVVNDTYKERMIWQNMRCNSASS